MKTKDGRLILLVDCHISLWRFIMDLRNDPRVAEGFVSTTPITWNSQYIYMNDHHQDYRVALVDGVPAGYVGVVNNDIRICTHPDFEGQGVGKFMIGECVKIWPDAKAKVKINNSRSSNLFLSCNFVETGRDENFIYFEVGL